MTSSTISGNTAYGGGGIDAQGDVIVTHSLIVGNWASFSGGGIRADGTTIVTNSTVSGNFAYSRACYLYYGGCQLTSEGGGISSSRNFSLVNLTNSIVAHNWLGDPLTTPPGTRVSSNCSEVVTDNGHNFADDDTCGPGFADITPDVHFDTMLADNGGPTWTHALLPGSIAIDAAGDCGLATDQRSFLRWDGSCDSGAFEFAATSPDADQDGVLDEVDVCLDTLIPESVPTRRLGVNRWALVDEDEWFDTTPPPGGGGGPDFEFTILDTGGCSCEQIIEAWALG